MSVIVVDIYPNTQEGGMLIARVSVSSEEISVGQILDMANLDKSAIYRVTDAESTSLTFDTRIRDIVRDPASSDALTLHVTM